MQSSNTNSLENQEFSETNDLYNYDINLFNDPPRGWSCICLNETIHYYTDHNIYNITEKN